MPRPGWNKILCAVVLPVFLTAVLSRAAENQLLNAGFEENAGEVPSSWTSSVTNGATVTVDGTVSHHGSKSLLLMLAQPLPVPKDAPPPAVAAYMKEHSLQATARVTQTVPVEGGKAYNLRFWYKAEGLKPERKAVEGGVYMNLHAMLLWRDAADKAIPPRNGQEFWILNEGHDAPDWVQVDNAHTSDPRLNSQPYVAPEGAASVVVQFTMTVVTPGRPAKVWLDDVVFEEQAP